MCRGRIHQIFIIRFFSRFRETHWSELNLFVETEECMAECYASTCYPILPKKVD